MYTLTQNIIEGLKYRVPFFDRYVTAARKDKKDDESPVQCIIDRVYTEQKYHVFALILRDSTPETLAANLLNPDQWIDTTREAVKGRKKACRSNNIHQMKIEDNRTEAAIRGTNEQQIRKSLREAHEIMFETEFDELPLTSHIKGWQFLIEARYEIEASSTLRTPTKSLETPPEEAKIMETV